MAQTGYTPISLYYSATASSVPVNTNLAAGELAINTNDGKLYYKDSSGVVQLLASKAGSSGSFGTISATSITNSGLTSGRVVYSTTGGLETDSANLLFNGTTLTANTLNLTNALGTAYGGTGLTSFTANGVVYASSTSALATGSALTFDGTDGSTSGIWSAGNLKATAGGYLRVNRADNNTFNEIKYVTSGDLFYFNQANGGAYQFNISASEQMRLTSTGLGIGTSSPATKLDVNGSISIASSGNLTWGGAYGAGIPTIAVPTAGSLGFYPNGSTSGEKMRIDSSGNVGIGGTPAQKLDVIGSGSRTRWNTSNAYVYQVISNPADSAYATNRVDAASHDWYVSNSAKMTLDSSGNVGIGVTSPAAKLDVSGTIKSTGVATLQVVKSKTGNTGSVANATATTLFALTGDYEESYIVNASVHTADTANYFAVSLVVNSDTARSITALRTVGLMTITLSGGNVQATQLSGGNAVIYWNATRLS